MATLALVVSLALGVSGASATTVFRAFSAGSWWNTSLPVDAPRHARSDEVISFLKATNVEQGCVLLAGAGSDKWGTPVYWASSSDPVYAVASTRYYLPPEFASLRIPRGARSSDNTDQEMTVYDREAGYVAWLYQAVYDSVTDTWSAGGGSIAYLGSNGLEGSLVGSDEVRNTGSHRGLNGALTQARVDEVRAGAIDHVLRIGVKENKKGEWVFPMTGTDGRSEHVDAPPQGTRLRIKPSVDLSAYGLHPEAEVIAEALQSYGAVIGDSTGAPVELKLEDTVVQGRGQEWSVSKYGLCSIPLDAFEVIEPGYIPPTQTTNQPPVAQFSVSCTSLTCAFDGSSSSDPDGTSLSYDWTFGDGSTSTEQSPTHTYGAAGDYEVTLTVTDGGGSTATTTSVAQVSAPEPAPVVTMHVADLDGHVRLTGKKWWSAGVSVVVRDSSGARLGNVGVAFDWSGSSEGSDSCTTDTSGRCSISTPRMQQRRGSSVTFTVRQVSHATAVHEPLADHDEDGDSDGRTLTVRL